MTFAATSVAAFCAAIVPAFAQSVSAPLTVTTLAGVAGSAQTNDGTGSAARFFAPTGVIVDASGNLIVADAANNTFRKVTPGGVVTTIAGTPINSDTNPINIGSTDGTGGAAKFHMGEPTTPPLPGSFTIGIDGSGNVYFADTLNDTIRKITPAGVVTTLAGSSGSTGKADGTGGNARFFVPSGVAADSAGNVYVADTGNHLIRKVTPAGVVTTFAGGTVNGLPYGSQDGVGTAAQFFSPQGIAIDASGNLYVADTGNDTIRKITPAGVVTTLAGSSGHSGTADGSGSQARFNSPTGLAVDSSGNVYVADTENHAIRKITPGGTVSTIAGSLGVSGTADGTGTAAQFNEPYGITVDSSGTLYIADTSNNTIRRGVSGSTSATLQVTAIPPSVIKAAGGSTVTLKVVATGSPAPTYQWYKDSNAISGATNATLSLNSVSGTDVGSYSVVVSNGSLSYSSPLTSVQVFAPGSSGLPTVTIVTQPTDRSVNAGQSASFTVEATSSSSLSYQWTKNGSPITGATSATYTISSAQTSDSGVYAVTVTDGNSTATTSGASLLVQGSTPAVAPAITTQPASQTVATGGSVTFTAAASGSPAPTFQWQKNGVALSNTANVSGATTASLTITSLTSTDAGSYTVVATNSAGSAVSNAATLTIGTVTPPPTGPNAWLTNVSVRTTMIPSPDPLIIGVTVRGGSKNILVRGAGPALVPYGVTTPLADPRLDLYNSNKALVYSNDNWDASLAATFSSVGAFPFPAASKDAAFVQGMDGGYTVQLPATAGGTVLVEAYDANPNASSPRLVNVSARNRVGTGQDILIAGFGIEGTGTKKLLIRAVGPKLADYGVTGVLADPMLEVYDSNNVKVSGASNDNWDASLASTFDSVGAFQLTPGSKDAAIVVTLPAGSPVPTTYTVQCKGADGGTGTALIEVYELP